ncbi:DUF3606 domain-containing protein [Bradyrhizobium sp. LHD-71]|uniref:DUF3606 domain-containing protein n=1 Tax=Bradyrhizobium sp. LHD-71 TaxID=3072141 RepID=UPI00280DE98B|nr:DUF3606 domain-containing protein [Bradyrhizobium sp. LHD-71]MDQ8726152.1 DUF3606 domain-containing protein [Bradyrhizobium sp. LHD-71]
MIQLVTVASVLAQIRPAPVIDTEDAAATDRWAQRLNVPRADLLAAIAAVGNSVAAVRRHLQSPT